MVHKPVHRRWQSRATAAGFGLVELMVTISVVVIVTSVVLTKHNAYNGASLIRGQAYELALVLREMQSLAVSATNDTTGFYNVYGLVFSSSTAPSYVVFRDGDGDYFYDAGSEEFGPQGVIDGRYYVSRVEFMGTGPDAGVADSVTILFERPNFDALFYKAANTAVGAGVQAVEIDIRLKGAGGSGPRELRTLEVTRAGQITVKNL